MDMKSEKSFEGLQKEFFDEIPWNELVNACPKKQCSSYQDVLRDKAKELEEKGQPDVARAARALQALAALQFTLDDPRQPFHGWELMAGFSLPGPQDFGEELLGIFIDLIPEATEPEFKARLTDVCWSTPKKRDFKLVGIAIESYLSAARNLFKPLTGETQIEGFHRWETAELRLRRAMQLAKMSQPHVAIVQQTFEECFKQHLTEAPLLELGRMMTCYQNELEGDIGWLISLTAQCVSRAEIEKQWGQLRHFLRLKANWQKKAGQPDEARKSEEQRAESYLKDAGDCLARKTPSYSAAVRDIARAITAYKEVSPKHHRIAELHQLLADYQDKSRSERQTFTYSIDTGIDRKAVANHVAGLPFLEALQRLSLIAPPLNPTRIRLAVEEHIRRSPFYALSKQDLIDEEGRVIAKRGAFLTDDPSIREQAIRAEAFRSALTDIQIGVQGFVEPARHQLLAEHNVSRGDFYPALVDSPFIPPGREYFFVLGLHQGLMGDFLTAMHLLVPQLEHAFRFHLEQRGVQITEINRNGVEDFMDMNALFNKRRADLITFLGDEQVFELECLLVRRYGANLRNQFAHGMLWPQQFFHESAIYLWWVTLRLCLLHLSSSSTQT